MRLWGGEISFGVWYYVGLSFVASAAYRQPGMAVVFCAGALIPNALAAWKRRNFKEVGLSLAGMAVATVWFAADALEAGR